MGPLVSANRAKVLAVALAVVGLGVLAFKRRAVAAAIGGKLTVAHLDQRYGPLRLGVDYTEGAQGRINVKPAWVAARIVSVTLFDGKIVKLHRDVAASFAAAYRAAVTESGYHPASVQTFVTRHILWDPAEGLSLHSYGIAVDFDPTLNPYGDNPSAKIRRFPAFIAAMERHGWEWGGRWSRKNRDDMHFQRTAG